MLGLKGKYFRFQALVAALLVHVIGLSLLALSSFDRLDASSQYAEIQWDVEFVAPIESQSLEDQLADRLQQQLANLASDQSAEKSSERIQSLERETHDFSDVVEEELAELERSTFEELAQSRAEDGGEAALESVLSPIATPDEKSYDWQGKAYNGQVTAAYDLGGRSARSIDIPGYRCEGAAEVELEIEVAPDGSVRAAVPLRIAGGGGGNSSGLQETCAELEAIKSALRSRFVANENAPKRQIGRLTYRFVPQ